ncbi:MAG: phosphogluconate dehydrogenase (NADP(+)-dependent, decarboxylating) [Prochlorococcus sp. MED-G73]|jgi:6-phosphogluconate dehydrogenase|uniref:6-phosphogluconate dehydrogenase, decarboxylating n=2 Tax=Prochlorococcus marinus TaxID=1219 RepID=Q46LG0_PROMT|nr:NADP-dependent phosphogluconate dehydrogenase [Prochlorococcus marinus]AAZ57668.1 6-phosphogluconate dehydrogenase (decarboxylating) [Prochlorococcus marinus str. NATL2A]ABM75366.1 6-phosphogluconate dehydrogenase [Prochlorococcus marinus str. NATL1A]MAJ25749.1 phosphogluconate dehydrogenase (NADP(+)-dependent, decarboxylating) [Prochlorococcus sp. MED630]RCL50944.1 MAG: phosphogluconate dehydrogenase (NADP(+)-dependent, decarboxylating) [Prochlorococcus sp. MED-G73]|tara:strand:- start:286 stop:1704 length:1419 start_codon:yes stop_codon:yes gene_type:complete
MTKAHFGLVGLGVMGENLVLNAERNGFSSVVYNRTYQKTEDFLLGRGVNKSIQGAKDLQEFVSKLERPRRVLMMVKAGAATDAVINQISPFLEEGDLLIDGGNAQFMDTERRVKELESKSFGYIGMGVSGGAKGALEGPSMMPGGTKTSYDAIESLLNKMAAQVEDGPCVTYIGPGGSGHFVKTVHNGIEYGIEQILAEAYDLMKRVCGMSGDEMASVMGYWNKTEELSSYLVEITEACLRVKDPDDSSDLVEKIMDKAGQKGTGLWTVVSALELGASVPTIYASLNGRVMSSMKDQRNYAETILNGNKPSFVDFGKPSDGMPLLMDAVVLATIASYAQGMDILRLASEEYDYDLDMPSIAQIWKGGCIIRSTLLSRIQDAFKKDPSLTNLIIDKWFTDQVNNRLSGLTQVVSAAANAGIPVPCLSSTLDYLNSFRTSRLPQNLVQAMRDCFGSHTYERVDKAGSFHTEWID